MKYTLRQLSLLLLLVTPAFAQQITFNSCHGPGKSIQVVNGLPYVEVQVGQSKGLFLIDFGTTGSTIDPKGFTSGPQPSPVAGSQNSFADFDFYGSWGTVKLDIQDHSNIEGVKQAGIIGTDFLSLNAYTIDFTNRKIYRSDSPVCLTNILKTEGFVPVSSVGYYSNDLNNLQSCAFNIPTVPVRIGRIQAVAQMDPGFDDRLYRHSININKAYFDALQSSGIKLVRFPTADLKLTTCTGSAEEVQAYKLPPNSSFEIIDAVGNGILRTGDAILFLKSPSVDIQKCGGIGTWKIPAAQIGASFMVDTKSIMIDPFNSTVWIQSNPGETSRYQMQQKTQMQASDQTQQIGPRQMPPRQEVQQQTTIRNR